jgi:hypothetical protein
MAAGDSGIPVSMGREDFTGFSLPFSLRKGCSMYRYDASETKNVRRIAEERRDQESTEDEEHVRQGIHPALELQDRHVGSGNPITGRIAIALTPSSARRYPRLKRVSMPRSAAIATLRPR